LAQPSDDQRPAIDEGELAMKVETDIRDNPAMSRFEMPLGDGALAVAYYKVEDGRVVLLHTEVPQELSGMGYGSRRRMAFSKRCDAMGKESSRSALSCPPMPPETPSTPYSSTADRKRTGRRRVQRFWTTIPMTIECMSKGNF
jgi:hypothetical protein